MPPPPARPAPRARGGDLLGDALKALASGWGDAFELHLVGHSAGSIALGLLLANFAGKDLDRHVRSVHLYAPACTVEFANRYYAASPAIMDNLYLDILSDTREQDDNVVSIYRKSLLYLVSNALEADKRMPILGLANVFDCDYRGWDGSPNTAEALANWRHAADVHRLERRLTCHDNGWFFARRGAVNVADKLERAAHGGFDNNVDVFGKTLERITGSALSLPITDLVGF
jgi:hypothetical protein